MTSSQAPANRLAVITGATRGLGLALARALDRTRPDLDLLLAVRDVPATAAATARFTRRPELVAVDLAQRAEVTRLADQLSTRPLALLVHNAGLQLTGPTRRSPDNIEETLAVNHLAPALLTRALLPQLRGGHVVVIGSGTHDPDHRGARRFGFRGARFTSIPALARGDSDATSDRQRGMDRYATSKLLAMATMRALARRQPETTFLTFDPGLMPGTGLARTAPWYARAVWSSVLRLLVPVMSDASTPTRSARALVQLLAEPLTSGEIYDHGGGPARHVWPPARDPELVERIWSETEALLA